MALAATADLTALVNVADVEAAAAAVLDAGTLGYYAGGAGDERTLRDNVAAFARRRLLPRVLVDVTEVTTAATVLGTPVALPVLVAPTALQRLAHPGGEAAMARAAAAAGTVFTLSTLATTRPRDVVTDGPRWLQLYVLKDPGMTRALLDEALDAGFSAVVLTVDAPRAGRRERDLRTGFRVPPGVEMPAIADLCHAPTPQEFFALVDESLTWRSLEELVASLPVPVVVKGIQAPADAVLAAEHGAAGVIVSNHGGRQLDGVPATLDLLEPVVQAVGDRLEVFVDGGVRRGTDVATALALGARAVLVGRPALWGLTAGGEAGARHVLELLRSELELALALLGAPSPAAITRAHVV
jgi:isopentenyl diphosphate isomerase/L-lactate dehydrogenase-like FMN-dependent dehydrogenase